MYECPCWCFQCLGPSFHPIVVLLSCNMRKILTRELMDLLISGCWHRGTRWPFTQWPFRHPAESFRDFSEEGVEISPRRMLHNLRGSVKFALLTCWQILLQNQPILVTINARFRNSRRKLVKVEIYSTSKFPNGFNLWFNRTQDNAPHTLNQHIPQL